jgi:phosphoribosylaminoimidazolecarboxamide formyltransferase/IMP cyclohydrolase
VRYGMNPHQAAHVGEGPHPLAVVNGEPSFINYLDALNAWQLVREARNVIGVPVAASFKHVSPAGVAAAGHLDESARKTWGLSEGAGNSLVSAYVRARDADPKSSFGDVIAVSNTVDDDLAAFVSRIVADAIVAPGFEPGVISKLAAKKNGHFLIFEADAAYVPPEWESREVFGMRLEQQRDSAPIDKALLDGQQLSPEVVHNALLALVTLRYTQSNSVALAKDGTCIGIGAGQQNRVDCVRLAAQKARIWWLRRHPIVHELTQVKGMTRQDRLNWQIRLAEGVMTSLQLRDFAAMFGKDALESFHDASWRQSWMGKLTAITMASDGFLPFRDNVDFASEIGVTTVVEPGGSIRNSEVQKAARELKIELVETGLRLFHH